MSSKYDSELRQLYLSKYRQRRKQLQTWKAPHTVAFSVGKVTAPSATPFTVNLPDKVFTEGQPKMTFMPAKYRLKTVKSASSRSLQEGRNLKKQRELAYSELVHYVRPSRATNHNMTFIRRIDKTSNDLNLNNAEMRVTQYGTHLRTKSVEAQSLRKPHKSECNQKSQMYETSRESRKKFVLTKRPKTILNGRAETIRVREKSAGRNEWLIKKSMDIKPWETQEHYGG